MASGGADHKGAFEGHQCRRYRSRSKQPLATIIVEGRFLKDAFSRLAGGRSPMSNDAALDLFCIIAGQFLGGN